jgi:hypothetical protein
MKILIVIVFTLTQLQVVCQTKNTTSKEKTENTLLEFYSKYLNIWQNTPVSQTKSVITLHNRLDSLMKIYCTTKLRKEAMKTFKEAEADLLTQNLVGDLNDNLVIVKDSINKDSFIVLFTATYLDIPNKPVKLQVKLQVKLVKEGKSYKINSVR